MPKLKLIDESGDKKYFTIIPNYILNHSTLWDREVYIQMKRITGEDGTCWTSRKTLAKQCGMSPRRLDASIKYLVEHEWIQQIGKKEVITRGGPQEVNEYRVSDLWDTNNTFYKEKYKGVAPYDTPLGKGVAQKEQRCSTDEVKGIAPGAYKEEQREEEPIKKNTVSNSIELQSHDIPEIINLFKEVNPAYSKFFARKNQREAVSRLLVQWPRPKLDEIIKVLPQTNTHKYAPTITSPLELEDRMAKLIAFIQKERNNPISKVIKV
jgi:hypothetical protein